MSWYPHDEVGHAINIYLDALVSGKQEDIVWSRPPVDFEPTPSGTRMAHDLAILRKVERLRDDHWTLSITTRVLASMPEGQYHSIIAKYYLVGLMPNEEWGKSRAYADDDRAEYVGQTIDQFKSNLKRARKSLWDALKSVDTVTRNDPQYARLQKVSAEAR